MEENPVKVDSSGDAYTIRGYLKFIEKTSVTVGRAQNTNIVISGEPVPEFDANLETKFIYDNSEWKFRMKLDLACRTGWQDGGSENSLQSTCKENSSSDANDVSMSELTFNATYNSQIQESDKVDSFLDTLTYDPLVSGNVSTKNDGLTFILDEPFAADEFPSTEVTHRYLILNRNDDAYRIYEFVLKTLE